jgi:hypothetical protein
MPRDAAGLASHPETAIKAGGDLFCAQCGHKVTHTDHAIRIDGQHDYVFFNPAGRIFRVACFKEAAGATPIGAPSGEFTWFRGYDWRIVLCGGCAAHLGWIYEGEGPPAVFFGLIRTMLSGTKKPG